MPQPSIYVDRLIIAGLLALCVALLIALVAVPELDAPLWIALIALTVSIPTLGAFVVMLEEEIRREVSARSPIDLFLIGVSSLGAIIAMAAYFWHFAWYVGVLFLLISGAVAVRVIVHGQSAMEIQRKKKGDDAG
jgi:arginine exporter protein ArgO